jgi:hypothetical protein
MRPYAIASPGPTREAILSKRGIPATTLSGNWDEDGFAAAAVDHVKRHRQAEVAKVDVFWTTRRTLGSSLGGTGIYWDYYLSDAHGNVVGAFRRFVD